MNLLHIKDIIDSYASNAPGKVLVHNKNYLIIDKDLLNMNTNSINPDYYAKKLFTSGIPKKYMNVTLKQIINEQPPAKIVKRYLESKIKAIEKKYEDKDILKD